MPENVLTQYMDAPTVVTSQQLQLVVDFYFIVAKQINEVT